MLHNRRVLFATVVALVLAVGGVPATAAECGCTETGAYVAPTAKPRLQQELSPDDETNPTYRVEVANVNQQFASITIRRRSNNAIVKQWQSVPLSRINYGWSPDGKRYLVRHASGGSATQFDDYELWDVDGNRQVSSSTISSTSATVFSPHGRYLQVTQLHGANWSSIQVIDAVTGQVALTSGDIIFSAPAGTGADQFGTVGTGFSSEPGDRSFIYAYRANNGNIYLTVRNLETRTDVYSTEWSGTSTGQWRFSPCGDAIGFIHNDQPNLVSVTVRKTASNAPLGSSQQVTLPASVTLETNATHHRMKVVRSTGTTYTNIAANTAATTCTAAPALSTLSLNRSSARGGAENATATITLTRAATANFPVTLSSSDTSAATVPSSTSVAVNATTKTFTVTTKPVTSPKTVTITATAGGVSRTATLTVNPPPPPAQTTPQVTGLALNPTAVTGGQTSIATVTLGAPAPTGGTSVALSANSGAASVPASVLVPSGATTAPVTVTTTSVPVDTPVVVTASSGGASADATLTVRAQQQSTNPEAIIGDPACSASTLPSNDDGSTGRVPLPFSVNFFGVSSDGLYVNNNGNVTFGSPLSTYTPFRITADTPPIIAPFLADVDTRGPGSGLVTHSVVGDPATFNGRPAFCANWIDVGYYPSQTDKLNSFQLLLVDRSDVGPGDFDIVMNYDRILWETGSASGGSGGFGGSSAGAGYSAGTGDPSAFYEFPGTLVNGALLDSNPDTGLTRTSRGTLQRGRHVFEVRNGDAPTGATLRGLVSDADGDPLSGAPVQVCQGTVCRAFTSTGAAGSYQAPGLPAGDYTVTVRPPAGSTLHPRSVEVTIPATGFVDLDVTLTEPVAPPPNTAVSPSWTNGQGIPSVYWGDVLDLDLEGCEGGTGTWALHQGDEVVRSGELSEGPAGTYTGQIEPLRPLSGSARLVLRIVCPDGEVEETAFDLYIDPSGHVRTLLGTPVPGALVTLYRADSETGPFEVVPDGSAIMSPTNRINPMLSTGDGHFGWDTVPGYYVVRAERAGCTSPDGTADHVETDVLPVPPEWTDLDLRLSCPDLDPEASEDGTAPDTAVSVTPAANAAGWHREPVTVHMTATDPGEDASGVVALTYEVTGAETGGGTVSGDEAEVTVSAEGVTTVTFTATDAAGNTSEPRSVTVRLDRTAPTVTCTPTPAILKTPNHKLVDVRVAVVVTDATSGADGFVLDAATSNEPDDGLGDGDTAGDIQGWSTGTADTAGKLRAERAGPGNGRNYELTYTARDVAGNTTTCVAEVKVPKGKA